MDNRPVPTRISDEYLPIKRGLTVVLIKKAVCELEKGTSFPLVVRPGGAKQLLDVVTEESRAIDSAIRQYGAVLFRGFDLVGEQTLNHVLRTLYGDPMAYIYRSTPRTQVGSGVYTATEYPPSLEIPLHNENAYQRDWPMRLGFHCVTPAASGGQTPLAEISKVTADIPGHILAEFGARGVMYTRNYSEFFDLPWQTVFQTDDRRDVERLCRERDIEFNWSEAGLRTWQICQGTAVHPDLEQELWFNQAHLFHVSSLGSEVATRMASYFGEDRLPRNASFGDGAPITEEAMIAVRTAFERNKTAFDWCKDDILLLDNMRIAHGRTKYIGCRRVLVVMGSPFSSWSTDNVVAADAKRLPE